MRKRILTIVLYSLFFTFWLFFFLVRGFPIQPLFDQIKLPIERDLGLAVTTRSLAALFPNGIEATDLRLLKVNPDGTPGLTLLIDMAKVRISLFGLLIGRRSVSFASELFSGALGGKLRLDGEQFRLSAQIDGIDIEKFPLWVDVLGLKLAGKISGSIDLTLASRDLKTANGSIELDLKDAAIGEGTIGEGKGLGGGFTIPPINFGAVQINLQVDKGKADIKTFKQQSDDLETSIDGYVMFAQTFDQFSGNYRVRFKPSSAFLAKNPKFQSMIDLSGVNNAKDQQGYFVYKATGRLTQPLFQPAKR